LGDLGGGRVSLPEILHYSNTILIPGVPLGVFRLGMISQHEFQPLPITLNPGKLGSINF
jgi:hypothetical protein